MSLYVFVDPSPPLSSRVAARLAACLGASRGAGATPASRASGPRVFDGPGGAAALGPRTRAELRRRRVAVSAPSYPSSYAPRRRWRPETDDRDPSDDRDTPPEDGGAWLDGRRAGGLLAEGAAGRASPPGRGRGAKGDGGGDRTLRAPPRDF